MQKIAFLIAMLGIAFLLFYVNGASPIIVKNQSNLQEALENQKVFVQGKVIEEKQYSNSRAITIQNNITLSCECSNVPKLTGKSIAAIGIIDTFQKTKIKVLKIRWS